jgi:hypothetical protein
MAIDKNNKLTLQHVRTLFELGQSQASHYLSSLKKEKGRKVVFIHEFLEKYNLNENILSKL